MDQGFVNQECVNQESMSQGYVNQELINQESVNLGFINQGFVNQESDKAMKMRGNIILKWNHM